MDGLRLPKGDEAEDLDVARLENVELPMGR